MRKISCVLLITLLTVFLIPVNTNAKTLKELENEVNNFTADLENKNNQIAANDAEVAEINKKIADIEKQISDIENETKILQQEIEESNVEIAKKSEESKSLFQYLQVSNGENAYLEYIFGATNVTDMVYRMAIVEQLTEYNEKVMDELTQLIEENKQRKEDLAKKNTELEKLTVELEAEQEKINAESAAIRDAMPSVQQQLDAANKQLAYYKKLGCGENEDITACEIRVNGNSVPSATGFYRPMIS